MKILRKRYANYTGPELRGRRISDTILKEHEEPNDSSTSIAHMFVIKVKPVQSIFMANKWIMDPETYIRLVTISDTDQPVDSISEIDLNPYVLTNYEIGDYVLR
jgi:hypothetical protein